tara:strand:+ start:5876 stop:6100 length:225 start_codon:yes stop_codon:yes gene_type:complete
MGYSKHFQPKDFETTRNSLLKLKEVIRLEHSPSKILGLNTDETISNAVAYDLVSRIEKELSALVKAYDEYIRKR